MYRVADNKMWWDDVALGPADAIYIDGNQKLMAKWLRHARLPSDWPRFVVKKLPVADYLFVAGSGHIVGVESKSSGDFFGSYRSRRLQRQSRELLDNCGIAAWGLLMEPLASDISTEQLLGVFKWQALGGLVLLLPFGLRDTAALLVELPAVIKEGRHILSIVSGTDRKRDVVSLPQCGAALQRLLKGVGPRLAVAIGDHFHNDVVAALGASDEEWNSIKGVHKGILKERRRFLRP